MNLAIPSSGGMDSIAMSASPFNPATIVSSMAQCNCSHLAFAFLRGCTICGNSNVDSSIFSTAVISEVHSATWEQPQLSNKGSLDNGDSDMETVDRYADIHSRGETDQELTLAYPWDDEDELSGLLAPYQWSTKYRISGLRSSLPQPEYPGPRQQLSGAHINTGGHDILSQYMLASCCNFRFVDIVQSRILDRILWSIDACQDLFQQRYKLSLMLILPDYPLQLSSLKTLGSLLFHYYRNLDAAI